MFVSLSLFLTTVFVDTPRAVLFVGSVPPTEYIEKKVGEADLTKLQDLMPDRLSYFRAGDVAIVWDKTDSLLAALNGATSAYKDFASSIDKSDGSVLKIDGLEKATKQAILNSLPWSLECPPGATISLSPCLYGSGKSGKTTANATFEPPAAEPVGAFRAVDAPKDSSLSELRALNDPNMGAYFA